MLIETKDFLAWVKAQDPLKTFNWIDNHECVTAQYLRAKCDPDTYIKVYADCYYVGGDATPFRHAFPFDLGRVHYEFRDLARKGNVHAKYPDEPSFPITYGDFAKRLESEMDVAQEAIAKNDSGNAFAASAEIVAAKEL